MSILNTHDEIDRIITRNNQLPATKLKLSYSYQKMCFSTTIPGHLAFKHAHSHNLNAQRLHECFLFWDSASNVWVCAPHEEHWLRVRLVHDHKTLVDLHHSTVTCTVVLFLLCLLGQWLVAVQIYTWGAPMWGAVHPLHSTQFSAWTDWLGRLGLISGSRARDKLFHQLSCRWSLCWHLLQTTLHRLRTNLRTIEHEWRLRSADLKNYIVQAGTAKWPFESEQSV